MGGYYRSCMAYSTHRVILLNALSKNYNQFQVLESRVQCPEGFTFHVPGSCSEEQPNVQRPMSNAPDTRHSALSTRH